LGDQACAVLAIARMGPEKAGTMTYRFRHQSLLDDCLGVRTKKYCAGGLRMGKSNEPELQYPLAHCAFCSTKTPHMHERLAVDGRQVARSLCLMCSREQPKAKDEPRSRSPATSRAI
jgi:hypothetical protein